MNVLNDLPVRLKLAILIAIAFLSTVVIGYTGFHYLDLSNKSNTVLYEDRLIPVELINENRAHINKVAGVMLELMLTTDSSQKNKLTKIVDERVEKFNNNMAIIEKVHLDDTAKSKLAQVKSDMQKYREMRKVVFELAMQNKNAEAYAEYVAKVSPQADKVVQGFIDLAGYFVKLSEQANEDNHNDFNKARTISISITAVSMLILLFSGWYIAKIISTPLARMVAFCETLSAGDFRDKPRSVVRKDEIGQVADAMAQMRTNIRLLMQQVSGTSEQVAASSEELTASAEQSAQAATQVAGSITEVSHSMENQLKTADDTMDVINEMSQNVQEIAINAYTVADQSKLAAAKATSGNQAAEQAKAQMMRVEETVNNSAEVVSRLGDRSKEIGQIVDAISQIAGQTNLLALNAAIEAARAGEAGRGFAVVAEEVRKLAEQSEESAKQIANLIREIQTDTDEAVVSMVNGTQEVKRGADMVNASGEAFGEIEGLVNQVSQQIDEISYSIEKLAKNSQEIVEAMENIENITKNTTGETQTISAATEEQSASMEEIASSSQALANLANELRNAVGKFRI